MSYGASSSPAGEAVATITINSPQAANTLRLVAARQAAQGQKGAVAASAVLALAQGMAFCPGGDLAVSMQPPCGCLQAAKGVQS